MGRAYALHIDAAELTARTAALGNLTGGEVGKAVVTALNTVVDEAYDLSRKRMTAGINLTDAYIRRKMTVGYATASKPQASISAVGDKTSLSNFNRAQSVVPVTWSNARITSIGKKFGKWPGWTQRTGVAKLGIAVDQKADGQKATVSRGAASIFPHAFSIPGKHDSSGNLMMFTRQKGGSSIRALLGPAVYQLFKYQLDGTLLQETEETLSAALADQVEIAMKKALS